MWRLRPTKAFSTTKEFAIYRCLLVIIQALRILVFLIVTANIINYPIFPAIIKGKPAHNIPKSLKRTHQPIEPLSLK